MGHSTSSGRGAGGTSRTEQELREAIRNGDLDTAITIQNSVERDGRLVTPEERRAENLIDRATFSGDGNIKTFQIAGIGAAQVRYGRDEQGNIGWTARVATPNTDLNPINGNRRFESREAAESRAREVLKTRVRAERDEFQRYRERQERTIRANNRILGRNMSDEEVARRATRGAEANMANRRRRRG